LADDALARAHLNLIESSRQLFALDPDAVLADEPGWLFGAGGSDHPVISNAAFRRDDAIGGEEFVAAAREFFAPRGRGFSIWVRVGQDEDRDLVEAAERAGLQAVFEMPEMVLRQRPVAAAAPDGIEMRRIASPDEANEYWQVAKSSYASLGFPPDIFNGYTNHEGFLAENLAAFIARDGGEPVAIAMTILSHGVAGIYWVGSLERARGRGIGRAITEVATLAGFELGADVASLQASPMGKPIYAAMGYETAFDYRFLMAPSPERSPAR
jgi:hypothetical protein